jgi:UDP-2-acetamido-3-amino-2,3-dideoxy-glucuronate N-acetyltransferase
MADAGAYIDPSATIHASAILHSNVHVSRGASVGVRVIFIEGGEARTIVGDDCTVEAGAIIGRGVQLGRGGHVLPGSVVLSSTPPNAIIEGNPARIVGYTKSGGGSPALNQSAEVGTQPLGVGKAALHRMRRITDLRGSLTVGELGGELPFVPQRYFMVFDVPSKELRGEHAHKVCAQFLLCAHGSCRLLLDDGGARSEVTLDTPDVGVFMPPRIWGTQYQFSRDAVLLVFASHTYDPDDYLRTYDGFLEHLRASP